MKKILLVLSFVLLFHQLAFGVAADMYVKPASAGDTSGSSWANCMGEAEFEIDAETNAEAGDRYFVAGGTYTLDSSYSCQNDGSTTSMIKIIGVDAGTTNEPPVFSDWADGANQPLFDGDAAAYDFAFDDYWEIRNIRLLTVDNQGFRVDRGSKVVNCYSYNSSGTANYDAFSAGFVAGYEVQFIDCEGVSTGGDAFDAGYNDVTFEGCYAHDSVKGFNIQYDEGEIDNCIIDTCTTGIDLNDENIYIVKNNVIYNCTTGISGTTSFNDMFLNNIIEACTTGASWTTDEKSNYWDYNCWGDNNTADTNNVTWGEHRIEADPSFTDPAANPPDFTLQSGSACLDAGLQLTDIVTRGNLVGDYKINIGADQDDVAAAGGEVSYAICE